LEIAVEQTITIQKNTLPDTLISYFQDSTIHAKIDANQVILPRNTKAGHYHCPIYGILKDSPVPLSELETENQINKDLER
jgi:hypothetical protein